jgi:L-methionine (R)-S-oxide reductase
MSTPIAEILASPQSRGDKARKIAALIRQSSHYRWVGVYDVTPESISVVGWSGPAAPAYPHFPATQGLCGAAAASGETIVVGDVTKDPRYLVTLGTTRSEMIAPVRHPASQKICGLVDVESERRNAFTEEDRRRVEEYARAIGALWES